MHQRGRKKTHTATLWCDVQKTRQQEVRDKAVRISHPRKPKRKKRKTNATKKARGQKGFDPCTQAVNAIDTVLIEGVKHPNIKSLTQLTWKFNMGI